MYRKQGQTYIVRHVFLSIVYSGLYQQGIKDRRVSLDECFFLQFAGRQGYTCIVDMCSLCGYDDGSTVYAGLSTAGRKGYTCNVKHVFFLQFMLSMTAV